MKEWAGNGFDIPESDSDPMLGGVTDSEERPSSGHPHCQ